MPQEMVLIVGFPASGKSTVARAMSGYVRLNRDERGGAVADLLPEAEKVLAAGKSVVLDNLFGTVASRAPWVALGRRAGVAVRCIVMGTAIEDAQYNASLRMLRTHGRLLGPDEITKVAKSDPGAVPAAVLFRYRNEYEPPTKGEGFAAIEELPFVREPSGYANAAVIFDYDGTLRETKSGAKYPSDPDDVVLLPRRREKVQALVASGTLVLGASNQGDVARGKLTAEQAIACFERTNELLGVAIPYLFCPHKPAPISCFCRKPMPGMGVAHVEAYKLDPVRTVYVGDRTEDKTFAARAGFRFVEASEYFGV